MQTDMPKRKSCLGTAGEQDAGWREKSLRLLTIATCGLEVDEKMQVVCPGTGQLDHEVTAIDLQDILTFRGPPEYGLVVFSFAENRLPGVDMIDYFQYCRMLLRPAGRIALLLPGRVSTGWWTVLGNGLLLSRSMEKYNHPASLLKSAGLYNIRRKVVPGSGRIIWGHRPVPLWRRRWG